VVTEEHQPMISISKFEANLLRDLEQIGGGAKLDQFGQPQRGRGAALLGQPGQWLPLVAKGLVAGEHNMIIITAAGRDALAQTRA
jgi:hypothetical protein